MMIMLMPLPMPRCADHLAEPHEHGRAGHERQDHEVAARPHPVCSSARSAPTAPRRRTRCRALAEDEREPGRLQQRDADREVAGVLRDLALPGCALLLELLQLRDHDAEDLHDDAGR
jgi:hypothetical protein